MGFRRWGFRLEGGDLGWFRKYLGDCPVDGVVCFFHVYVQDILNIKYVGYVGVIQNPTSVSVFESFNPDHDMYDSMSCTTSVVPNYSSKRNGVCHKFPELSWRLVLQYHNLVFSFLLTLDH